MPRKRLGLNASLAYVHPRGRRVYRVRSSTLTYGFQMVAAETQARQRKAFYPHKTAPTQFSLGVDLIGYRERKSLMNYLMRYVEYILDPAIKGRRTPQMVVTVPSRNFRRVGVPVTGYEFGDNLGLMVAKPQIVFETAGEPWDWDDPVNRTSRVFDQMARTRSPETEFFYPTGTQLSGEEEPEEFTEVVQGAVNGDKKKKKDKDKEGNPEPRIPFVPEQQDPLNRLYDMFT